MLGCDGEVVWRKAGILKLHLCLLEAIPVAVILRNPHVQQGACPCPATAQDNHPVARLPCMCKIPLSALAAIVVAVAVLWDAATGCTIAEYRTTLARLTFGVLQWQKQSRLPGRLQQTCWMLAIACSQAGTGQCRTGPDLAHFQRIMRSERPGLAGSMCGCAVRAVPKRISLSRPECLHAILRSS